jgi:GWxTD domain-containing protein
MKDGRTAAWQDTWLAIVPSCRLVVCLLAAPPLAAQSTEQRRQIDALGDTLRLVTDTMALREREGFLLRGAARSRDDPFYHLYLGTLALRQGELGGPTHLDEAAAEFRWAASLAPQWSYAWFGAGAAEFLLGGRLGIGRDARRTELAQEAYFRGAQDLARAISLEPALASRVEALGTRAARAGSAEPLRALRKALANLPARSPRVLLTLGRVERLLGDSGAVRVFADYLATRDNSALGLLELGRTQLLLGDLSGMNRYLAAAGQDDPASTAELRSDLEPVAGDSELAEFDRRRGASRSEYLRRFWIGRDRLDLRRDGERLAEHLRRLAQARREYLVLGDDGTPRFDDRGRIYLRHGEPPERVRFVAPGVEPNESWCYRSGGKIGNLVLHFVARQSPEDYRLVESLLDITDARGAMPVRHAAEPPGRRFDPSLFRSRSPVDSLYRQVPVRPADLTRYLATERALGRRSIRIATSTDSDAGRFSSELDAWGRTVVAGSFGASPVLQVLFSVRLDSSAPPNLRMRLVALDSAGTVVASVDSLLSRSGRSLRGRITIPVRPGRMVTHAVLMGVAGLGSDLGIDTLTVASLGRGDLAMGDLLVGAGQGIPVNMADGRPFVVAERSTVSRDGSLQLAAEVFGLSPQERATVRVLIAPDPGEPWAPDSSLRWRGYPDRGAVATIQRAPQAGPVVTWRAMLPLKGLGPGRWRLAVITSIGAGQEDRREAAVVVGGEP